MITGSCIFIPASELALSNEGWEDINNSSNITFGDANRTLYTLERLQQNVEFDDPDDEARIDNAIAEHGAFAYIDLEN